MQKFIDDGLARQITEVFHDLSSPVQLGFFGSQAGCQYCGETRQLVEEVADLSEKLSVRIFDLEQDAAQASEYHVDKTPTIVLLRMENGQPVDYGVRFSGIPAGHEFTSLVNDIVLVSGGDSALEAETREFLKGINTPVLLQVFTTPT